MRSNDNVLGKSIFTTMAGQGTNEISYRKYNTIIGLCVLWGLAVNAIVCVFFGKQIFTYVSSFPQANLWICIGYVVFAIVGAVVSAKATTAGVTFLGYNMIVLPLGIMLCVIVGGYSTEVVSNAFVATTVVTGLMLIAAEIWPKVFLSMGRALIIALLAVVVVELINLLIFRSRSIVIDAAVVLIFSLYIGFDWARSQRIPMTVKNAVSCACSLYLDIINIFIRLLAIFGRRN